MVEEVNISDADFEKAPPLAAQPPQFYKINAYPQNILKALTKGGCFRTSNKPSKGAIRVSDGNLEESIQVDVAVQKD
jgi:hypothetical protein